MRICCKVMCKDYLQERKELVEALHKGRRFSNLPKITQVSLSVLNDLYMQLLIRLSLFESWFDFNSVTCLCSRH